MPTNLSIKRILLFLYYSLSIAVLLRLTAFGQQGYTSITCFIGLSITVLATYWIQKEEKFSLSIIDKLIYLSIPIFFFIMTWLNEDVRYNFTTPFGVGIILILINFYLLKDLRKYRNTIFYFLFIYGYCNLYFENWQYYRFGDWRDKNVLLHTNKENDTINTDIDLAQFNFIDTKLDTIKLSKQKPYTFLITWDEYCGVCKTAFKDLNPVLEKYPNVEKYYVYNFRKYQPKSFIDSFKDQSILADKKVVADYNYSFTERIALFGNPTLVVVDNQTNKIIYLALGYSDYRKKTLMKSLDQSNK